MVSGTRQLDRMVAQLEARGIQHPAVRKAMREIPRERFVDEALRGKAYSDTSLPIGQKQTISQPWVVARMSELTAPTGGGRVLEIGTGSGYQAAVLSKLFEQVYTVERLADLSRRAQRAVRELSLENIHFKIFDGTYGWSEFAPYRAIVVTAASPEVPGPLFDQLDEGGRMVLPLGDSRDHGEQELVSLLKQDGKPLREEHGKCRFVPLLGKFGWAS